MAAFGPRYSFGFMWERSEELSRREHEVLDQIRLGLTNRQIAARLGVSTNTINKHVQEVLRKLEVDNRVQAALHGLAVAVCSFGIVKSTAQPKGQDLIVIGAGIGGGNAAVAARKNGFARRNTLIGVEPDAPYDPPPAS